LRRSARFVASFKRWSRMRGVLPLHSSADGLMRGPVQQMVPIDPAFLEAAPATEDSLEPARISPDDQSETLLERTFGHGQGTKAQQSGDPKTEAGEGASEGREPFG
jgi:hypothetical protein